MVSIIQSNTKKFERVKLNICLFSRRVETSADLRALWLHRLVTTPVAKLVNLLYGRLLPLDHLLSEAASGHTHPEGAAISAPSKLPCAYSLAHAR